MSSSVHTYRIGVLSFLLLALPALAAAQVPREGQVALGAEIGVFLPTDGQFNNALVGGGLMEVYLSQRLGLRASVTATAPEFQRVPGHKERQIRLGGDVIYNWEGGRVHPFAGIGMGVHMLRVTANGRNVTDVSSQLGVSALGGFEYFLNPTWTFKTEGRYQWVGQREPGVNPDGFALTFGLKRYF